MAQKPEYSFDVNAFLEKHDPILVKESPSVLTQNSIQTVKPSPSKQRDGSYKLDSTIKTLYDQIVGVIKLFTDQLKQFESVKKIMCDAPDKSAVISLVEHCENETKTRDTRAFAEREKLINARKKFTFTPEQKTMFNRLDNMKAEQLDNEYSFCMLVQSRITYLHKYSEVIHPNIIYEDMIISAYTELKASRPRKSLNRKIDENEPDSLPMGWEMKVDDEEDDDEKKDERKISWW